MLAAMAAIGMLLPVSRAAAAKIDITPSISLNQAYDSNIFNTDGNEVDDFILYVTPAVTLSLKGPGSSLDFRAAVTADRYYRHPEHNSNSSNSGIQLSLASATPLVLSPVFTITPSAHYVEAQDSYRRNQLVPPGDPSNPTSIASETGTSRSRDYGGALMGNYLVTPTVVFSLGGGLTKRQFLDNVAGGNRDSRVLSGNTTLTYQFTPIFSTGLFFNTSYNTFESGRDSRILAGGLSGSYGFSPAVSMSARAGASRATESDPAGLPDRTTTSPTGSISVAYAAEDFNAGLSASIDQSGGGSFGRTTRRQSVVLSFGYRFAPAWSANLSGNYEENRSLDAAVTEDLTSTSGTAGIGYQPATWATLHLSGTAFRQWSNGAVGSELTRYSAFLGITLGYTYNIY